MPPDTKSVTRLLHDLRGGDRRAFDDLIPIVYDQLHKLAAFSLRAERPGHTLPATALVHEAYLRLVGSDVCWNDRVHFYAVAARVMRRILVDHAKSAQRGKRGGGAVKVPLEDAVAVATQTPSSIVSLDEALDRLSARDKRKSEIVELLFFGGMTYDETAEALGISAATVHRELKMAKAWLHGELAATAASA